MKALFGVAAILAFSLVVTQLIGQLEASSRGQFKSSETAYGFILYRNAVNTAAYSDPSDGSFADSVLGLPSGFINPGYHNRKASGICYVWAETVGIDETTDVFQDVGGSLAWQVVKGGQFVGCDGSINSIAVPAWLPEDSLVSMVQVH